MSLNFGFSYTHPEIEISFKFIPKILMIKECIHFFGPFCICTRRTSVSNQDTPSVSRETGSFKLLYLSAGAGATGYTVWCSKSGMGRRYLSSSDRPDRCWGPPSIFFDCYRFLGAFAEFRKVSLSFVMSVRPPKLCLLCALATELKMAVQGSVLDNPGR
jgi:hypothetical protein